MAKSTRRRGYNAYLSRAKSKFGLTHSQARKMYRLQSAHAGEPINSRSIIEHPRLAARFAGESKKAARKAPQPVVSQKRIGGAAGTSGGTAPSKPVAAAIPKRIRTIRDWNDYYDRADAYEDLILNAGVDTGRGKGKR